MAILGALLLVWPLQTPFVPPNPFAGKQEANPSSAQGDDAFDPKPFRIRDIQAARWQLDEVEGHIQARRWSEAIDGLQSLIEEHPSDVLQAEFAPLAGGGQATQATHRGAAKRARTLLFTLPDAARSLYCARHQGEAQAALEHAWSRLDRRALWEVVRRYPLAPAAARAAWTIGDLAWEKGEQPEALAAWERALSLLLGGSELELATAAGWQMARERLRLHAPPSAESDAQAGRATPDGATAAPNSGEWLPAIARRVQAATEFLARREQERTRYATRARPPGRDSDAWFEPFVLPNHPFTNANRPSLGIARSDDSVFVSTSLRVLALDAYTGALRWRGDEAPGWAAQGGNRSDFFKGIDISQAWIAPAASSRAVVAALQIPVAFIKNEEFQKEIGITVQIPDRRLFAYDADNGRELWNQMPPPDWDGDAGGFVERMSIAGPPVIVGTRVLVPCYRIQGRIHYAVACFDLDSGALLWSTDVVSGQRELNMFGRHEREFCAPEVVVAGERVIALTQVGAIACLDLYSGEVHWVTLYDQIPLQRNHDFGAPQRLSPWRNQAPVVSGSTVVAAPFDSWDLVGLDLAGGKLLWSLSNRGRNSPLYVLAQGRVDQLVGARDDQVFLAAEKVVALRSPSGLSNGPPNKLKWVFANPAIDRDGGRGRAVLADDRIVVPTMDTCLSVDVQTGVALDEGLAWGDAMDDGNLLLGERELFVVSNRRVCGYFDWGVLVQRARARLAETPGDTTAGLALARLLANRGTTEISRGRSREARAALVEARGVLEGLQARAEGSTQNEVAGELHGTLRALSRVHHDLAEPHEALAALRRARALAPNAEELRDTLLEELRLERDSELEPFARADAPNEPLSPAGGHRAAREALYAELEARCGTLTILCDPQPSIAADAGGDRDPAEARFALEPLVGLAARDDLVPLELPLPLWALFAREREAIHAKDTPREFELLHRILAENADAALIDDTAGERAHARIGELVQSGRTAGYEPFEQRAEAEYAAAQSAHDRSRLVELARRFPFSTAARRANDARLSWATDSGDLAEVAHIVQTELAPHFTRADLTPRALTLLCGLASTARRAGNVELADELLRTLGTQAPGARIDVDGVPLAERARDIVRAPWRPALPPAEPGRFAAGPKSLLAPPLIGDFEIVARSVPDDPARAGALLLGLSQSVPGVGKRADSLYSFEPGALDHPAWRQAIAAPNGPLDVPNNSPWTRHVAIARGRVIVARADGVVAYDEKSGEPAWTWNLDGATPRAMTIAAQSGVAVLATKCDDGGYLYALDTRGGAPLWQAGPLGVEFWSEPLLSSHAVVSLPMTGKTGVVVRDLFTGREISSFSLELNASQRILDEAWIENDRLIVPRVKEMTQPRNNRITCIDLETGRNVWQLQVDEIAPDRRYLERIVQHHDKTYLVLTTPTGPKMPTPQSGLYELSTSIGAVAPVHSIRFGSADTIVGTRSAPRVRLASSLALVISPSTNGEEARVRAIDLESGELWSQGLRERYAELNPPQVLPLPAWSDTSVGLLVWLTPRGRDVRSGASAYLTFLDRASGVPRDMRPIDKGPGERADWISLYPLDDVLVVRGSNRVEFLR